VPVEEPSTASKAALRLLQRSIATQIKKGEVSAETTKGASVGTAIIQGDVWSGSPHDWAELQEPLFRPIYEAVLKQAGVRSRQCVLDVGCGSGLFCNVAAKHGAQVAGIDAAPGLIEVAKSRTPSGDFRVGEMEELPFDDGVFDLVTGFNSFQFASEPANALRQAQRVVKPTGKIAMAIWGRAQDCQAASVLKALSVILPPPPPGAPGPFALSEPGVVENMLLRAGLKPEQSAEADTPFVFSNDDTACRAFMASGPGILAIRRNGDEKVRATLMPAVAPFKKPDGSYRMENKFKFVIAAP
jgi:2-polyprenyl-3-methyl-5-hydroxy-6-metoxy-1,4-benzoquinol methylase